MSKAAPAETQVETPTPSAPEAQGTPSASSPPPEAPNEPSSIGAGEGEEKEVSTPANWPSNWREIMAGGDQKALQRLNRYASPANVWKALHATGAKISAGELMRAKPEGDPNDPAVKEAMNEWRAQAGVPEAPEGYLEKVPDGLVFGDADKPILESFLKDMHADDAPPAYVHKALQWYKGFEQQQAEQRAADDKVNRAQVEDTLRSEWGPEYRPNLNNVRSMLTTYGAEDMMDRLFAARMADGTPLGDDEGALKMLVSLAREINPHGAIPTPDSTQGKQMTSEMETIRKAMGDSNSDYWRGPKDATGETQMQRRFRELTEIQQKRQGR